jgi:hypothetical protein
MKLKKIIIRRKEMNPSSVSSCVKTPAAVLLYMLNFQKGRDFEADYNGKKIISESGENRLVKIKNGHHKEYAVKVTQSNKTAYFVEPFMVESFPDNDHILSFHCKDTIIIKN